MIRASIGPFKGFIGNMVDYSGMQLFQIFRMLTRWQGRRWGGLIIAPMVFLVVVARAEAQDVRVIQTPAPYNACNLRSGGGTQYGVLGTFLDGTSVTLLGEYGRGWYRVQVGQEIGWMWRQCLGL